MSPRPMELSVLQTQGFESQWIISIRVGSIRRQGPIGTRRPFLFPVSAQSNYACRIDIYRPVASSPLSLCQGTETYSVLFPTIPGCEPRALTLGLRCMGEPGRPSTAPVGEVLTAPLKSPAAGRDGAPEEFVNGDNDQDTDCIDDSAVPIEGHNQAGVAAARDYLDKYRLLNLVQDMLGRLLREKPAEPFPFLLAYLQKLQSASQGDASIPTGIEPVKAPSTASTDGQVHQTSTEQDSRGTTEARLSDGASEYVDLETVRASAKLVAQNVRLQSDNRRLRDEMTRLEENCEKQGMPKPVVAASSTDSQACRSLDPRDLLAGFAVEGKENKELIATLSEEYRRLCVEHEMLRVRLCGLALTFARHLNKVAQALQSSGLSGVIPSAVESPTLAMAQRHSIKEKRKSYCVEEETDSDSELDEEAWKERTVHKKRKGVSAEAHGAWNNRRAAFVAPANHKSESQHLALISAFSACPLFGHISVEIVKSVTWAMPLLKVAAGHPIIKQGDDGDALFVIISGQADVYNDSATPPMYLCTFERGRIFGELAMLYNTPRALSIYSHSNGCILAKLTRSVYQNVIVRHQMCSRERREVCLGHSRYLDTLSSEQIARLADTMEKREYQEGSEIVKQGEMGDELFIIQSGECAATVQTLADVQEHRRYQEGDLFGERALLFRSPRAATVTSLTHVEVLCFCRKRFNRLMGPLSMLQLEHYKTDPRKMISDFYRYGDKRGARGCCVNDPSFDPELIPENERSEWFAVYRPTSRDAIAKMLSGDAVGKGLNVKGKSAKQGRISGFVPFMQISKNADKELLSPPDASARVRIFYKTDHDRERMLKDFVALLDPQKGVEIHGDRMIDYIDTYAEDNIFGLDIPEPVLREVYITRADISFQAGWETGRKSEPGFMEMNIAGLRKHDEPKIVLFQSDMQDCFNPHGLLIAYAERTVKPVVSDFDTFLVGSHGMAYEDLPPEQVKMLAWSVDQTESILKNPGPGSWTSRWLTVLKDSGMHCKVPKYGFGDAVSYWLISEVIDATIDTGAVRHGAECFNYIFPQELDDTYLVVWHGFPDHSWEYLDEDELRDFLIERAKEGFTFPLNPVWLVRDLDWYDVYEALISTPEGQDFISHYFTSCDEHGSVADRLKALHDEYPDGFLAHGTGVGGASRKSINLDMDSSERIGMALMQIVEKDEDEGEEELIEETLGEIYVPQEADEEEEAQEHMAQDRERRRSAPNNDMPIQKDDFSFKPTLSERPKKNVHVALFDPESDHSHDEAAHKRTTAVTL